jgi:hypothetical protein
MFGEAGDHFSTMGPYQQQCEHITGQRWNGWLKHGGSGTLKLKKVNFDTEAEFECGATWTWERLTATHMAANCLANCSKIKTTRKRHE